MNRKRNYTDADFIQAVSESFSVASALKKLGLAAAGGNYSLFHKRVEQLGLNTEHFTGQGHLKGKNHTWTPKKELKEILVRNSPYTNTYSLKNRLLKEGLLTYQCNKCGIDDWMGKPLALHLGHINGVNNDNRIENLRLLCPNCHSQTDTYAGKNKGKG